MLLFVLRDGTKFGITDHDRDIDFNLPEQSGDVAYSAGAGFKISNVQTGIGLEAGSYEVTGPLADIVTLEQLLGGRWRQATTYLFEINWKDPSAAIDIMKGSVTKAGPSGGEFKFEVQDERFRYGQTIGRFIVNQCPRDFAACCVNIAPETETTIASVTSTLEIEVDATITGADFINGKLWFTTGDLAGTDPVEIYTVSGSTITLYEPLVSLPAIGDELTLKEGCDGTREQCRDRFDNVIENRGFLDVPGTDQVMRQPIPGQGND